MSINIDNYEAYLVDYLDGRLTEEESQQLKQFVAQQGLVFDELVQDLPSLEPKPIEYQHKEALKKQAAILPLLAKIAAAAAVTALLFGLFWNRNESLPQDQPMAEQKIDEIIYEIPEQVQNDETHLPELVAETSAHNSSPITINAQPQGIAPTTHHQSSVNIAKPDEVEATHDIIPLLVNLEPRRANEVQFSDDYLVENGLLPQIQICPIYFEEYLTENEYDEFKSKPSLIEQGFLWVSNGKCDNLGELIHLGLHRASHDVIHYTTKAALTAYYTIDTRIEESREKGKEEVEE